MKRAKLLAAATAVGGFAVGIGFLAAAALITVWGWVFPFREEWDDTWHEFLPVGLAYLLWLAVGLAVFLIGLRLVRRRLDGRRDPHDIR